MNIEVVIVRRVDLIQNCGHYNNKWRRSQYDIVVVKIKDTGIGIHPDISPKLFTKFVTQSYKGGTGLGLFIFKNIIEGYGGKIWAGNTTYDGETGATFSFILPVK